MQETPGKGCRHCCTTYAIFDCREVRGQGIILLSIKTFRMRGVGAGSKTRHWTQDRKIQGKHLWWGGGGGSNLYSILTWVVKQLFDFQWTSRAGWFYFCEVMLGE